MKRLTGTNKEIAELLYQEQLELSKENRDVERTVQAIIEDVKERGDEALRDYSAKFDKVDLTDIEVGQSMLKKTLNLTTNISWRLVLRTNQVRELFVVK